MSEQVITKICFKCKEIKPLSDFYKRKNSSDGHRNDCKNCRLQYYQTKTFKEIQKRHRQSEKGKKSQKRYWQSKKGKAYMKQYRQEHKMENQARSAINNSIRDSKLPRANTLQCHYGNHPAKQYHHWHGYEPEHWLDVIPICIPCHIF